MNFWNESKTISNNGIYSPKQLGKNDDKPKTEHRLSEDEKIEKKNYESNEKMNNEFSVDGELKRNNQID